MSYVCLYPKAKALDCYATLLFLTTLVNEVIYRVFYYVDSFGWENKTNMRVYYRMYR